MKNKKRSKFFACKNYDFLGKHERERRQKMEEQILWEDEKKMSESLPRIKRTKPEKFFFGDFKQKTKNRKQKKRKRESGTKQF